MRRGTRVTALAIALSWTSGMGAGAQERSGPGGMWGLSFVAAEPVGDLSFYFDRGWGGQIDGVWPMSDDGRVRIRGDAGFLNYGHERLRYCYTSPIGCRIEADLTTTNNIVYVGVGPEMALRLGPWEPYAYGTAGVSWFATVSSLSDDWADDEWAETTNYSDLVMALKVGAGMRVYVSRGHRPVSLDFGVERHRNGVAHFLTEGDIVDNPDGSVTLYPNRSEANLTTFRLGVSLGLGGRHD